MAHMAVLAKIRNISAVGAATVAEARALIQEAPPQVVVLDMRLPDGTGLDVIAALEAASANALVIVASAYLDDYLGKLPRSERVHLLGKPVPMHELRRIVENAVNHTAALSPFTVLDYVQLACMGHHSAIIECYGSAGRGEIIVEKGELWSAEDRQGHGVAAFDRLLLAKRANARPLTDRRQLPPRNLSERWELMVLDTLRAQDEQAPKSPLLSRAAAPSSDRPAASPKPAEPAAGSPAPVAAAPVAAATATAAPVAAAPVAAATASAPTASLAPAVVAAVAAPVKVAAAAAPPEARPTAPATTVKVASLPEPAATSSTAAPAPAVAPLPIAASPQATSFHSMGDANSPRPGRGDDQFDACVERALRAVVAKNFALAIAELEKAQAIRPGDPLVTHRLARLRSLLG
jgi:CheY-like chemotaxis protein